MHVLVTGHTGFKGAWAVLLLRSRGYRVSGIALDPAPGSLFDGAGLPGSLENDLRVDIRDSSAVLEATRSIAPDLVLHMAAQSLVRTSYVQPRWTMETNVLGTLSVLEAIAATPSVRAAVMVTTDKVYRNIGQTTGYVEGDALGGRDPYSASKAMADILISSWTSSFPGCPTAIARAGNVIGGGDVSVDRLLPDLIRGFESQTPAAIRNPDAIRPWQHVLDCLNGYLLLLDALQHGDGVGAWNFGPDPGSFRTVREVADRAARDWGNNAAWVVDDQAHPHEEPLLTLDSSRARTELSWRDILTFDETVQWTVDWSRRVHAGEAPADVTGDQIRMFIDRVGTSA